MALRGIKKKEFERLDDATVARVVSLLGQEKPITKKAACETLNISYNTGRLDRIIQEYKDKIKFRKKRFKANKGKPFFELELQEMVANYLNGDSISTIADSLYRSSYTIKNKIKELHLPERSKSPTYHHPDMIPDEAVSEVFDLKELVWSARYNAVAEIRSVFDEYSESDTTYSIWVFGKHNEFAYQPWWELGKLEIVKKYKLTAEKFIKTEKPNFAYRIN